MLHQMIRDVWHHCNESAACQKTLQSKKLVEWTPVMMVTLADAAQQGQM